MSYQTPTLVQSAYNSASITSGTFTVTLNNTPANGNLLILSFAGGTTGSGNPNISSISQTGVTWNSSATVSEDNASSEDVEIWIGSVSSGASTTITITVANGASTSYVIAVVGEWSGLSVSAVDQTQYTAGSSGTSPQSATTGTTATTTQTVELWIGAIAAGVASGLAVLSSPTNSFTLITESASTNVALGYLYYVSSAEGQASTGVTATLSGQTIYWDGCIATFKAAAVTSQPITYVQRWLWCVKRVLERIPRFRGHVDMSKHVKWNGKIWQLLRNRNSS